MEDILINFNHNRDVSTLIYITLHLIFVVSSEMLDDFDDLDSLTKSILWSSNISNDFAHNWVTSKLIHIALPPSSIIFKWRSTLSFLYPSYKVAHSTFWYIYSPSYSSNLTTSSSNLSMSLTRSVLLLIYHPTKPIKCFFNAFKAIFGLSNLMLNT